MNIENQRIVEGFRNNDSGVIHECYKKSWRVIRKLTNNKAATDDLLQDSLLIFYEKYAQDPNFTLQGKFTTFIYGIAQKNQYNAYRKKKLLYNSEITPKESIENELEEKIHEHILLTQKERIVHQSLNLLKEECKKLILAVDLEQREREQIYKEMQVSATTGRKRISDCRKKLATIIVQNMDYKTLQEDPQFAKIIFRYLYQKVFVPLVKKYALSLQNTCKELILKTFVEQLPLEELKIDMDSPSIEVLKEELHNCKENLDAIIEAESTKGRFKQQFPAYPQLKKYVLNQQ